MRRTILLVDDNLKEYDEIINALFKEGFKVICCDNAESALSTFKEKWYRYSTFKSFVCHNKILLFI